jgi:hypothetical protein
MQDLDLVEEEPEARVALVLAIIAEPVAQVPEDIPLAAVPVVPGHLHLQQQLMLAAKAPAGLAVAVAVADMLEAPAVAVEELDYMEYL